MDPKQIPNDDDLDEVTNDMFGYILEQYSDGVPPEEEEMDGFEDDGFIQQNDVIERVDNGEDLDLNYIKSIIAKNQVKKFRANIDEEKLGEFTQEEADALVRMIATECKDPLEVKDFAPNKMIEMAKNRMHSLAKIIQGSLELSTACEHYGEDTDDSYLIGIIGLCQEIGLLSTIIPKFRLGNLQ